MKSGIVKTEYTKWEKLTIYYAVSTLISFLSGVLIQLPYILWHKNSNGTTVLLISVIIIILGLTFIPITNIKKYNFVKNERVISYKRAVVIDSMVISIALLILWVSLYVPIPFSWEEFLKPNNKVFIIPIGAYGLFILCLIPTLITNKRVINNARKNYTIEEMGVKYWDRYHIS